MKVSLPPFHHAFQPLFTYSVPPVYFYCLDALPLFFATVVYAIWWPGRYFDRLTLVASEDKYQMVPAAV